MAEDEKAQWDALAPLALSQGTLTTPMVPAFAEFCQMLVLCAKLKAAIDTDGLTYIKVSVDGAGVEHQELRKHPLLGEYRGLQQRIATARRDFRLTPNGKAVAPDKEKPKSALEALQAQGRNLRAVK